MTEQESIQPNNLAYDLRQTYARIVGFHLAEITEARIAMNFYDWFNALKNLHTIIKFKYDTKEKDKETKSKDYNDLKDKIVKLANEHQSTWLGSNKNAKETTEISDALRDLEEFLYQKMHDAKMFGEGSRIAGL